MVVEADDRPARAPGGAQERRQEGLLGRRRVGHQPIAHVAAGFEQQRQHQLVRLRGQARQVEDALQHAADRVDQGHADARERLQELGEVLGPVHGDGPALLHHRAEAVGARPRLVVQDAGQRAHPVEPPRQRAHAEATVDDAGLAVGQDHARPGVVQLAGQAVEDVLGRPHQAAVPVVLLESRARGRHPGRRRSARTASTTWRSRGARGAPHRHVVVVTGTVVDRS